MFALVNDVEAYSRRFDWCDSSQVIESSNDRMVARLELRMGALKTWFTTENSLSPPHHIVLELRDGPFRRLSGRWEFHSLDECACKVNLSLTFESSLKFLGPAFALGFQRLADRMVDDFIRVADADPDGDPAAG